ncbi:outer envelope pore protein 16-4, chloroplastic-like isoform X2 [Silene latifolia]|uniref:outer envelope pore protein 16-4, chloroplastic-like isoform X2 n=1 Tax=Silene latifolia TaxID=37657 RepID=UPI003D78AFE8
MDDDFVEADTPCSSMAVDSIARITTAGALWGSCIGPYDANKLGIFAGIFTMTRCGIQNYRGRSDVINAAAAGAIVGGLIAAGTRSKKQVAGMAALLSILGAASDYSRTF